MKRMGEEVVQLQGALSSLEVENSRLRQQANMYEDTTRAMMSDALLDGMTKAELLEKYGNFTNLNLYVEIILFCSAFK